MSDEKANPPAEEVAGLKPRRVTFERGYYDNDWKVEVQLEGKGNWKTVNLELDGGVATEIMRLLIPVLTKQAAEAAQKLADESKRLADAVGNGLTKALNDAASSAGDRAGEAS